MSGFFYKFETVNLIIGNPDKCQGNYPAVNHRNI